MDTFPNRDSDNRQSHFFRWQLILTCLFAASTLQGNIQFAEELFPQLSELIKLSAENGREIQINALRIEERLGDVDVATGQRRPQVRGHVKVAGAYETRSDIDDRFRGSVNANLTFQQALYHWGNLDRYQSIAEERVSLEQVESIRRSERYFMQIRYLYLQWLLMKERQQIVEQSVALSESFVGARRQLVEVGQSTEQDVLEMEARLLENHESIIYIEKSVASLEQRLRNLVGPGIAGIDLSMQSLGVIRPLTPEGFEALAGRVRMGHTGTVSPEVEKFSLLSDIESDHMSILEKDNHPKLDLVAGIFSDQIDGLNSRDNVFRIQYFAGVQVNWSIFDGWQKDGRLRSTIARKRAYDLQQDAARENFRQRTEDLLGEIQLSLKQIEARSKRADILERRVALVREQVERDLLPGSERIEVEIDFLEVRQRLEEARVNYLINLMELGVWTGQDPAKLYYSSEQ